MPRLAIALLLITGCVDEHGSDVDTTPPMPTPVSLAEFPDLAVHLDEVDMDTTAGMHHLEVSLPPRMNEPCPLLKNPTTASIGGHVMPMYANGRYVLVHTHEGNLYACLPPLFIGDVPELTGPATLELSDASTDITFELGDLLAPRTAMPVGQPDWAFKAGEDVVLAWSPASDLAAAPPNGTGRAVLVDATLGPIGMIVQPKPDGVHLAVYDGATAAGDLTVSFSVDGTCGEHCSFTIVQRVTHAATIAP